MRAEGVSFIPGGSLENRGENLDSHEQGRGNVTRLWNVSCWYGRSRQTETEGMEPFLKRKSENKIHLPDGPNPGKSGPLVLFEADHTPAPR